MPEKPKVQMEREAVRRRTPSSVTDAEILGLGLFVQLFSMRSFDSNLYPSNPATCILRSVPHPKHCYRSAYHSMSLCDTNIVDKITSKRPRMVRHVGEETKCTCHWSSPMQSAGSFIRLWPSTVVAVYSRLCHDASNWLTVGMHM